MNEQVEQFFARPNKWQEEFHLLREIIKENNSLVEGKLSKFFSYHGKLMEPKGYQKRLED